MVTCQLAKNIDNYIYFDILTSVSTNFFHVLTVPVPLVCSGLSEDVLYASIISE